MNCTYAAASCLLAALVFAVAPGCHRASATDDDHDDHLEHHVPPHKPQNLSGAIDQIERRFEALAHARGIPAAEQATQLEELVDIVRWLPEIAGDSDLPEAQWNMVDRISQELWPLLQDQLNQVERGEEPSLESLHNTVSTAVQQLREITRGMPAEDTSTNRHQGHHHD